MYTLSRTISVHGQEQIVIYTNLPPERFLIENNNLTEQLLIWNSTIFGTVSYLKQPLYRTTPYFQLSTYGYLQIS